MAILKYWQPILAAFITAVLAYMLHTGAVSTLKLKQAADLAAQAAEMQKQCDADKALTKGAQDALQKNLDDVNRKLAALKRVRPAKCVPVIAGASDAAAFHGEHAGQNGISTDWLRDYAAECESIRQVEQQCDKFLDDERAK